MEPIFDKDVRDLIAVFRRLTENDGKAERGDRARVSGAVPIVQGDNVDHESGAAMKSLEQFDR
jgi:hypothetical protein